MIMRYLFVGPTLQTTDVPGDADLVIRPPVAAGDLLALPLRPGDVVGIIDGYFHQNQAIPHKEILAVLDRGVRVLGAASIGALRAAELHSFGMTGIGGIFADYRDGRLRADDEVALLHGPAEDHFRPLSAPLVNIRAGLAVAVRAGLCTAGQVRDIVGALGRIPYRDRNHRRIDAYAREAGLTPPAARRLADFCRDNPVDRKRADGRELVVRLTEEPAPRPARRPVQRTVYLQRWELTASAAADLSAMRMCQVLAASYPLRHRNLTLTGLVEQCRRDCGTIRAATDGPARAADAVRHGAHRGFYSPGPFTEPFSAGREDLDFLLCWTTAAERATCDTVELLARFLVRALRIRPGIVDTERMLADFRREPAHARMLGLGTRVRQINEMGRRHRTDFDPADIATEQITAWLCARWSTTPDELELAAFDRGFSSTEDLLSAARPVYLAARCDAEIDGLVMTAVDDAVR
ncbi:TfuA-like protein [Paractinoplanes ferrugineus]|uniref:TfuA-like core domain-containing protein n=1 Tax=Paractinoplanes ferrugineus TaxID=113564 RepID=A0A919J4M7_9ACTN|nr:TfuA-like protein [Actinoplanes ferrugineus]GIE13282.1 hypothetical protein Afe05nite_51220 [Actinoplanes ferrugineus]